MIQTRLLMLLNTRNMIKFMVKLSVFPTRQISLQFIPHQQVCLFVMWYSSYKENYSNRVYHHWLLKKYHGFYYISVHFMVLIESIFIIIKVKITYFSFLSINISFTMKSWKWDIIFTFCSQQQCFFKLYFSETSKSWRTKFVVHIVCVKILSTYHMGFILDLVCMFQGL